MALATLPSELASGIDALYLSGRGEVAAGLLADLDSAKTKARDTGHSVSLDLGGVVVEVEGRGLNKHAYRLLTPHGYVGITGSRRLPAVDVQPFAEHLHAVGPAASVDWFSDLVGSFTRGLRFSARRLDVFSDWQGWAVTAEDRHRFVGRCDKRTTREEGAEWTGFEFGRRSAGTIAGRIYDKTREIQCKGGEHWPVVWGPRYRPGRSVTRVEFEFARQGLREHGVESVADALELAPALWVTAATDWLTLRRPTADTTRSRWPVDPAWERIQRPSFAEHAVGLERMRQIRGQASLRAILPGLFGYLSSAAALVGAGSVEELHPHLLQLSRDYEVISGTPFIDRVASKRRKLRLS